MRQPDKRRFIDAINHIERPDIPLMEIDPDMHIVNQIMGKQFPMGMHAADLPVDDFIELNKRMGNDIAYFSHVWRLGRKEMKDDVGRLHYVDGLMKDKSALKDLWFPDLNDFERRLDTLCNKLDGTGMGVMCGTQTAAFTTMSAIGYQDFLMKSVLEEDFVMDFIKRVHEYCIKEMEITLKYPVVAMKMATGLIYNSGSMVDPASYEKLEFQFLREQFKLTKDAGKIACFHIDGKLDDFMEDIIACGVDLINPIDPCGGAQDIYQIKKKYGDKIAISGNINIEEVLLHGTTDQVKQDVIEHIDGCAKDGGYVVSSSHNLHELIPVENYYAMRDATHSHQFKCES